MAAWATDWSQGEPNEDAFERPVLAVVGAPGVLASWLESMCETLCIRMRIAADAEALSRALETVRPVAVICGDLGDEGRPASRLLRLIAAYDRMLPVLLMTPDDPETLGSIDAAAELWPLARLEQAALPMPVTTVLDFLARAGQVQGQLRMMPI